jgi:hypothetical protein
VGLFSKLSDAASMFWLNCDALEKQIVLLALFYVGVWLVGAFLRGLRGWVTHGVKVELERDAEEAAAA